MTTAQNTPARWSKAHSNLSEYATGRPAFYRSGEYTIFLLIESDRWQLERDGQVIATERKLAGAKEKARLHAKGML